MYFSSPLFFAFDQVQDLHSFLQCRLLLGVSDGSHHPFDWSFPIHQTTETIWCCFLSAFFGYKDFFFFLSRHCQPMLAKDKQHCLGVRNDTPWEEKQRKTPRRTWRPPLALLAPSLHFRESKWTAKGREQPKIASLEFSSMPLLLSVIASLRSNRSPSSYFKLAKECVLQRWCHSHLNHESSLGSRVKGWSRSLSKLDFTNMKVSVEISWECLHSRNNWS